MKLYPEYVIVQSFYDDGKAYKFHLPHEDIDEDEILKMMDDVEIFDFRLTGENYATIFEVKMVPGNKDNYEIYKRVKGIFYMLFENCRRLDYAELRYLVSGLVFKMKGNTKVQEFLSKLWEKLDMMVFESKKLNVSKSSQFLN